MTAPIAQRLRQAAAAFPEEQRASKRWRKPEGPRHTEF